MTIGLPELLVVMGMLALFSVALFLLVAAVRGKQSRSVQRALIDKLPPNELADLLRTPHGEKLMQTLADAGGAPERSILASIERGIGLIMTGAGLFAATVFGPPGWLGRSGAVLPAMATLLVFVGSGVLVAAFVSYRLSKRWRLLRNGSDSANRMG